MLRILLFVVLCLAPVAAAPDEPAHGFSRDALRDAIYDRDFETVESTLAAAQGMFISRRIATDDIRDLYSLFESSHPAMIGFAADWVEKMPGSPYAHAAQSWAMIEAGWTIRGTLPARQTYPDALRQHSFLHAQARQHALQAYELNPRLISASDALLVLGNSAGGKLTAFNVLTEVMETDPNMGTLKRALFLSHPGWGGTFAQASRICDAYADMVKDHDDPLTQCRLKIWNDYYPEETSAWAIDLLRENDDPALAVDRVKLIFSFQIDPNAEDAAFAFSYLSRNDVIWPEMAEAFDLNFPPRFGYPYLHEVHFRKDHDDARRKLEHDPYNVALIEVLRKKLVAGGWHYDSFGQPYATDIGFLTTSEEMEYVRRLIQVQPYHSTSWWSYADLLVQDDKSLAASLLADAARVNAVVFSNHQIHPVHKFLIHKMDQYDMVEKMKAGKLGGDWTEATDDFDGDVLCPLIRIIRVHGKVCEVTDERNRGSCRHSDFYQAKIDHVFAEATADEICQHERSAPAEALLYTPIHVDFQEVSGG